jgi:hypothetical protein
MNHLIKCAIVASLGLANCSTENAAKSRPPPDGLNALVAKIPAGSVISGFKHGQLRKELDVRGFSISKQPITWAQYRACMDAETCSAPALACANADGNDEDAALCVGHENARAYCAWSGGRLPYLSEWFLAARGRSPQRFSWGDGAAGCEQHALARDPSRQADPRGTQAGYASGGTDCTKSSEERLRVGRHAPGASSYGVEDVMLVSGELLEGQAHGHFPACSSGRRGCIVYGLIPGAIDAVRPALESATPGARASATQAESRHPYTFRCVWSEGDL